MSTRSGQRFLWLVLAVLAALPGAGEAAPLEPATATRQTLAAYGRLPLSFVENRGQSDPTVAFVAHGRDHALFLSATETVFVAQPPRVQAPAPPGRPPGARRDPGEDRATGAVIHLRLLGADASVAIRGEEQISRVHYLIGRDRSRWRTDVPAYARVRARGVYPGVDVVFYGHGRQFEYDFIVAPGADPRVIRLGFEGMVERDGRPALHVDGRGDLVLATATGDLRLRRPLAYQEIDGARHPVPARYVSHAAAGSERSEVRIEVAAYDPGRPLVIDPVLDYATYLGGGGNDASMAIAVDSTGHAYVTGYTESPDFPAASGPAPAGGSRKAFVAKLNPAGSALVYATYLGGDGADMGTGIAVDAAGRAYVAGQTDSTDFPTSANAYQQTNQGGTDAFLTKLDPAGATIEYSTYLGGTGSDAALGVAVGSAVNPRIYVAGYTESTDFPRTMLLGPGGGADAFVLKVNPFAGSGATSLAYAAVLGGTGRDEAHAIAVDALGQAHITGLTESASYPVHGPYQQDQPGTDAFVTKLNEPGNALLYSSYLGGAGTDVGLGIALDATGVYVTGHTDSGDFPRQSPYQATLQGGADAFLTKLDPGVPGAISLLYSTYLGGSGEDAGLAIAVDPAAAVVYIAGYTDSTNFPMVGSGLPHQGDRDAFAVKLKPGAAVPLVYSTYVGGSGRDEAYGIALDPAGGAYIAGLTQSGDFPAVDALATTLGGSQDAFVAKLVAGPDLVVSALSATAHGAQVTVTETTKNQGELAAAASTTRFYLSLDAHLDTAVDVPVGSRFVPALAPGLSNTASSIQFTVPASTPGGSYFVIAAANADGLVSEVDGSNNTAVAATAVDVGPDLIILSLDVPGNVGTLEAGQQFTVTESTRNTRPAPAGASTTRFYLAIGTSVAGGDVPCASAVAPPCFLGSRAVPLFTTAGTSTATDTVLTVPSLAGTFSIVAKADADNAVAEVDENNNVGSPSAPFAIGPDLRVEIKVPGASSFPAAGAPVDVEVKTFNDGVGWASPSTTTIYLSTSSAFDATAIPVGSRAIPALAPHAFDTGVVTFTVPAGHVGTRWIFARADDGSAVPVAESNEGNNLSLGTKTITVGADLIVLSLDVPGIVGNLSAGDSFTVADETRSANAAPAGPSTTRFYLVTGTTLVGGDLPCAPAPVPPCSLGSRPVPALDPSTTNGPVPTTLTVPPFAVGTFRIIARADADNAVAEIDESNNVSGASAAFTVGPDLLVTLDLPGAHAQVPAGATISIADFTKNDGGTPVGPSTTRFFLSSETNPAAGFVLLGSRPVPALGAGATSSASGESATPLTLPTHFAGAPMAGRFRVTAAADADNAWAETSEANNVAVSGPIAVGPDLTITGTSLSVTSATPGLTITVSDFTKNRGAGAAPASTNGIYLSGDGVLDAGDAFLGSRAVGPLGPTGALDDHDSESTAGIVIPASTPVGCYFIIVAADIAGAVAESDEGNNALARPIVIASPGVMPTCAHLTRQPDFDDDGKTDILWRHESGLVHVWFMAGGSIRGTANPGDVGPEWTIQGTGDFNGDGKADILWRHESGLVHVWFMDGGTIVGTANPGSLGPEWTIQGAGDFNGDGKVDILWRHESGLVHVWFMDGGTIAGTASPGSVGPEWAIQGTGDFNGDGKADILWRHESGLVHVWFMDGGTIAGTASPGSVGPEWAIQGTGDFNGNGKADILWRHDSGLVHVWFMDGGTIAGSASPGAVGGDWTIHGVGDVNGDSRADILWRHQSGLVHLWFMTAAGTISVTATPATIGPDWVIQ